ncbi:hypothetical protein BKA65DRAFT_592595 [Rhexocercosporidium sp. MPI-PUGE-AT-0058]|nr:hypothetical protein BKA65DRAFT_592595 [Rhexocercosporidium sp. MPI-PUGE-AT-0058]
MTRTFSSGLSKDKTRKDREWHSTTRRSSPNDCRIRKKGQRRFLTVRKRVQAIDMKLFSGVESCIGSRHDGFYAETLRIDPDREYSSRELRTFGKDIARSEQGIYYYDSFHQSRDIDQIHDYAITRFRDYVIQHLQSEEKWKRSYWADIEELFSRWTTRLNKQAEHKLYTKALKILRDELNHEREREMRNSRIESEWRDELDRECRKEWRLDRRYDPYRKR